MRAIARGQRESIEPTSVISDHLIRRDNIQRIDLLSPENETSSTPGVTTQPIAHHEFITLTRGTRCFGLRPRDQAGGAVSLWVVLMVPVSAFAAVMAMAGPHRQAAESSVVDTASDLATLAVALRDGRDDQRRIDGFLPGDCSVDPLDKDKDGLEKVCKLLLGDNATGAEGYLHRDLGNLGVNTESWSGFYGDEVTTVPCQISDDLQTREAVYLAFAADWNDGGWAAAQAWPDGVRMATELIARYNGIGSGSSPCQRQFELDPDSLVLSIARTGFVG